MKTERLSERNSLKEKENMKHIIQTIKLIAIEIRTVVTKVLDVLASPYWSLYNTLLNRDFARNPEKYSNPTPPFKSRFIEDF